MNKSTRKYLEKVCQKWQITLTQDDIDRMSFSEIEKYIVEELKKRGLDEYEIRQEFLSDWEVYVL